MQISIDSQARTWLADKGTKAVTIKEAVSKSGCCAGVVHGVVVEKGEPWEKNQSYEKLSVENIDVYVASNITRKAKSITIILKRFIFPYLGITGYEPSAF